jgi:hypothetical protein
MDINTENFVDNVFLAINVDAKERLHAVPCNADKNILFLFNKFTICMGNTDDLTLTEYLLPPIKCEREGVFAALHVASILATQIVISGTARVYLSAVKSEDTIALTAMFTSEGHPGVKMLEKHTYQISAQESFNELFQKLSLS